MQLPAITLPLFIILSSASSILAAPFIPIRWENIECGRIGGCGPHSEGLHGGGPPEGLFPGPRIHPILRKPRNGTALTNSTYGGKPPPGKIDWVLLADLLKNRTALRKHRMDRARENIIW